MRSHNRRLLPSLAHTARNKAQQSCWVWSTKNASSISVANPTEGLNFIRANLPVLDDIDPYVRSRFIEWYVVHKAKAMHQTRGTVMSFIIGDAASVLGRLHLVEQIGMIACFYPEDIVTTVIVQGLDVGGIGTQTIFGDDELEMRVVLAQLGDKPFGGVAC